MCVNIIKCIIVFLKKTSLCQVTTSTTLLCCQLVGVSKYEITYSGGAMYNQTADGITIFTSFTLDV